MEVRGRWPWSFAPNRWMIGNDFVEDSFGKAATGSPVIVAHCDGSVRDTDIVHEAVFARRP